MKFTIDSNDSINDTLKKMKDGDTLFLKNGLYEEKIVVLLNNINIVGETMDEVVISNHDWFTKIMPDYNECNTFRTYTLLVAGNNVSISNLTIENTSTPSSKYGQAVALYVEGDNFKATDVILKGAQDTLFTGPLPPDLIIRHQGFLPDFQLKGNKSRQIYKDCQIYGDVDFIFGTAQALFINCDIISIPTKTRKEKLGYISAPAHNKEDEYGYLFYKCNMTSDDNNQEVYLARPWRDYGTAAFIDCNYGKHISKLGFNKWNNTNRDKTARFYEYNRDIDITEREPWANQLTKDEKDKYIDEFFKLVNYNK